MLIFRLLGPFEVAAEDGPVAVGPPQQRAVLALLLLDANRILPARRLIDGIWGDEPPPSARNLLQGYVSHLRRVLAPYATDGVRLVTRPPGYLLEVDADRIDVSQFARLRRVDDATPERAAASLRQALDHWRGPALADLAGHPGLVEPAARLDELRLQTIEDRIEADLALARHAALAAELPALIAEHPYRERLRAALILALYRSGRQADALDAYRDARTRLVDDLGLEPGPALRELETGILRHDPALVGEAATTAGHGGFAKEPPARVAERARVRSRRPAVGVAVVAVVGVVAASMLVWTASESAPRLAAGGVGFVEAEGGALTDVLPVSRHGGPLAVADDTAWVSDQNAKLVTSVDLASDASRPYGVGAPPTALAAGGGSVWVAHGFSGTLSRILPAEGFVGAPFRPTRTSTGKLTLALDGPSLWVGSQDRRLVELETGGLRPRRVLDLPAGPRAIEAGSGALWAIFYRDSRVLRVDAASGALRRGSRLGSQPVALAADDRAVWVATRGDNRVWRLDARTGEPIAGVPVGEPPTALTLAAGAVWIGGAGGTLSRVDPDATALVATLRLGRPIAALAPGQTGVWISVR